MQQRQYNCQFTYRNASIWEVSITYGCDKNHKMELRPSFVINSKLIICGVSILDLFLFCHYRTPYPSPNLFFLKHELVVLNSYTSLGFFCFIAISLI